MVITLLIVIFILLIISGFFSGSETSLMSLNRHRLKYLAKHKTKWAATSLKLLKRPDQLLATILLGNTLANNLATFFITIIADRFFGNMGAAVATIILTLIILIFSETIPKTIAAIYNEKYALFCCNILNIIQIICYPLVLTLNVISNAILLLFGVNIKNKKTKPMSTDELRSIVTEPESAKLAKKHRSMLLGVLDLEVSTIKEVMLPRNQIQGINLKLNWEQTLETIQNSPFSKLVAYEDNIDNITGVLSLRKANKLINLSLKSKSEQKKYLQEITSKAYFVPETTTLHNQLIEFQKTGHDLAVVVDEYGDIQGIVTLKDILEEIVGELDQQLDTQNSSFTQQDDQSYIIKGHVTIREINRHLNIELPVDDAKTLSGLITNYLDELPKKNTSILIKNYPIEIIQVKGKAVKKARIMPKIIK
jgi:Mg2+/Co2+ transporter CorB